MGFVYIVCVKDTNFRKIGYSDQSVTHRLRELQTGSPHELVLEHSFETRLHREIERLLHASLAQHHHRGEWFDVPLSEVMTRFGLLTELIQDEHLLPADLEDQLTVEDEEQSTIPLGKRRCPYCSNLISTNNIRRHMQSCQEFSR